MDRPAASQPTGPDLRSALATMYANLQQAAVQGVVPQQAFQRETEALGLGEAERGRLLAELGRLKIRVGEPARVTGPLRRQPAKAAPATKAVRPAQVVQSSRIALARRLLERFTDDNGTVTMRATEGVIRLAGLSEPEGAQLRALVTVIQTTVPPPTPVGGPEPESSPAPAPTVLGDLDAAVSAARAILAEDRFARNTAKRILTAIEEVGLIVLVRGGPDRLHEEPTDAELNRLDPSDERRRARDCLMVHNQGLVHGQARQYSLDGMDYDDIAQLGMLGLLRATRGFDPTMGYKFSTYATQWVRQSITRGIANESNAIRIPVHMHEQMQKVARAERQLRAKGLPTPAAAVAVACDLTVQKVDQIRQLSRCSDSLDRVIGEGTHLSDLIEDRTVIPGVEHTVLSALTTSEVLAAVDTLPERYGRIVVMRFGLDGNEPATLDQIGKELEVTRERIRQLESQVVPVLRLAFASRTGAPAVAMQQMLDDPWHRSSTANPVNAIVKDLRKQDWAVGIEALRAFREREGHVRPTLQTIEGSFPLGAWLAKQLLLGGIGGLGLPAHRRFDLEALGVGWPPDPTATVRRRQRRRVGAAPRPIAAPRPSARPQPANLSSAEESPASRAVGAATARPEQLEFALFDTE
ncbi:sigma-70 family RNA polymerase sigma factor [Kitasatospora viridis]|uniref:RNA polymerase sigma factor (Sigma-70 family) n=1 Tax=Kitasatospora viridis TaxID=281105 RepID=A0A561UND4_9ACTN|nr:sigma-70 family RNA polymerase sigma factor [Kitasatospora viridis]TWG00873.1 RNA polymerase sigma factor (sigma-70 family) [Kitasatospora viridis]